MSDQPTEPPANALLVVRGDDPAPGAARAVADMFASEIDWTVLTVIAEHPRETTGATGFAGPVLSPDEMDSMASAARVEGNGTAAVMASALGDRPITQLVERGDVATVVQEYRAAHAVDLIVTASPDLADLLVGAGLVPVLVMPEEVSSGAGGPVLVAVDGSDLDEQVVATASRLFSESTGFVVIHVAPTGHTSAAPLGVPRGLPSIGITAASVSEGLPAALRHAEAVAAQASTAGGVVDAVAVGSVGEPVAGILDAAAEHGSPLIVLGTHDRSWLSHLVRPSVTDSVLRRSHRPVMVIATSTGDGRDEEVES